MKVKDIRILKDKLPKRPFIIARAKYFNSAVLIPLVLIKDEYYFLFQKRAANIAQQGEVCFPGGKYEPKLDKDYKQTAIRETVEELGIKKNRIKIIGRLGTLIATLGAAVETFVGILEINSLKELKIDRKEVEDIFLLPVSFFQNKPDEYQVRLEVQPHYVDQDGKEVVLLPSKELGLPELYHKPWGRRNTRIFNYKTEKGPIWGMTAELIYELIKILV